MAVLLWGGGVSEAAAQSCGATIDRIAGQYGLSLDEARSGSTGAPATAAAPPATTESRGVTQTQRAGQSEGVLTPHDTGAPVATQPPTGDRSGPAGAHAPADQQAGSLSAGDRTRMEALLGAARAAAREGRESDCLDRTREAQAVPGVSGARRPQ